MTVTLKPGQAAAIKPAIRKGVSVRYQWSTAGGAVNYDTHGEPVNAPEELLSRVWQWAEQNEQRWYAAGGIRWHTRMVLA